jgi:hypothetical protein
MNGPIKMDSSHDAILVPTWPLPWLQLQLMQLVWGLVFDRQGVFRPRIFTPVSDQRRPSSFT